MSLPYIIVYGTTVWINFPDYLERPQTVTWYTSGLPEATRVRLRLPNSHALLGVEKHHLSAVIVFVSAVQQQ